jgi:MoxR-like ATPase
MHASFERLRDHIARSVIGQSRLIERLIVGILAGGHLLLEGVPGLAKTTAVRALAEGTALRHRRIQFTPDMIPGDITGTDIFVAREGRFDFVPGPIFSDVILADEINRAPPKVQAALLEAMQEGQVTVGGTTRELPAVFMVIATQNPIEHEGTYPLPEAQLDRFMMKIHIDYPSPEDELAILRLDRMRGDGGAPAGDPPAIDREGLLAARRAVREVHVDDMLERYVVTVVGATREPARWDAELAAWLSRGASPRATLALAHAARARALLLGRDFVEPDDVLELAADVVGHRLGLSFGARAAGVDAGQAMTRILECVPVP